MTGDAAIGVRAGEMATTLPRSLTDVELTWIEKTFEHWIRFGRVAQDRIVSRRTRVVSFRPGAMFAFVRWASNDFGTVVSRIDVVRAASPGEPYATLPFVTPGGEILLHVAGWPRVERVLQAIDAVEAAGVDPCDAAPDHWRHVHNRLAAGLQPRAYTILRHRAWLRRLEIQS
jgi:hypothetical protein